MPEVKVGKQLARQESTGTGINDWFRPAYPLERLFGLSPFATLRGFTEEMDRMFRGKSQAVETWAPTVDIQRCNGDLVVTAELPGLRKEDVKVEVTENALIIEGERKLEHKEDHEGYHRYERSYGNFYRAIPLPEGAKTDQTKAELNDGILRISVPVPEAKKNIRQITVEEPAAGKKPAA
jgi:HSP20 family protein